MILARDPRYVLSSYCKVQGTKDLTVSAIGYNYQLKLLRRLAEEGVDVPVISSDQLCSQPEWTLRTLCDRLEIEWDPAMLSWPAGPKECDGIWASTWYSSTHKTTGFSKQVQNKNTILPTEAHPVLDRCSEMYEELLDNQLYCTPVQEDPRNQNAKVFVTGLGVVPRSEAKISVFDSIAQTGDSVWEGLRVYDGYIFQFDNHIDRLRKSAKALGFDSIPSAAAIRQAVFSVLKANGQRDSCHGRLTLTRGEKFTTGMSPYNNVQGPTVIVIMEWKPPVWKAPMRLITASGRRNNPQFLDSKIHHNSMLNNVLPKIEANFAGVDDALMLDINGFVAETNSCNVFIVKNNNIYTPHPDACLPGLTRNLVVNRVAGEAGFDCKEKNISIADIYSSDEMFTSGTMGELTSVVEVDGRVIGNGQIGPVTRALKEQYKAIIDQREAGLSWQIPSFDDKNPDFGQVQFTDEDWVNYDE